jgi:hypothetical protein
MLFKEIIPLQPKLVLILFKNSLRTSKGTQHFTITKINRDFSVRIIQDRVTFPFIFTRNISGSKVTGCCLNDPGSNRRLIVM